jgi:hypothetical protein
LTQRKLVAITVLLGFATGLLVLGIGGRVVMRVLTVTLEEPPRFTIVGTLEVIGAGGAWGALTGPVLLLLDRMRAHVDWAVGPTFGALVLILAFLAVGLVLGFGGRIVAPTTFILLAAILFPALFLVHGVAVEVLVTRWVRLWRGPRNPQRHSAAV